MLNISAFLSVSGVPDRHTHEVTCFLISNAAMVLPVPSDSLGVEVTVRVESGVCLVSEEDPVNILVKGSQAAARENQCNEKTFHINVSFYGFESVLIVK